MDEEDDDQNTKQLALKGLIAHLGYSDENDPDPDEAMHTLLSDDANVAQNMKKKKGGGSGGGGGGMNLSSIMGMLGGGSGGGGGMMGGGDIGGMGGLA